jgi:hypothetical protein
MRRLLIFVAVVLGSVAVSTASAQAADEFSVFDAHIVFSAGPCDPNAGLQVNVGVFAPDTQIGLLIDYPGTGGHEGISMPVGGDGIARFLLGSRPQLIGGTTTLTAFLDADLNLEPDPGSPVVTTTVTYCPPPLAGEECKKGGFENFPNLAFKNQGDCVSYVETAGSNPPAG